MMPAPSILFFLALLGWGQAVPATAPSPAAPSLDKQKVAEYLSYAEGFSPDVKITIDDPQPTAIPGFFRLVAHLTLGDTKEEKTYFLTADGKKLVGEPLWDLTQSPFASDSGRIPTDGPSFGPADAKVTMVIFDDFECPYCRKFATVIRDDMRKKYPNDVRVVFKDYPLVASHPWAEAAAEAAHCVADGKPDLFWTFHDWIYEHQGEMTPANLRDKVLAFAKDHQLDDKPIGACIDSHAKADEVKAAMKQGDALGVGRTPTFFLNGRKVPGALPWESLDLLIQMELHRPAFIPAANSSR